MFRPCQLSLGGQDLKPGTQDVRDTVMGGGGGGEWREWAASRCPIVLSGNFSMSPLPAHPTFASPKLGARKGEGGAKSTSVSCGCPGGGRVEAGQAPSMLCAPSRGRGFSWLLFLPTLFP